MDPNEAAVVEPVMTPMSPEGEDEAQQHAALQESRRRFELRRRNLQVDGSASDVGFRKLDSSLKKCTAFVRKLKAGEFQQSRESLLGDALALNLSRYLSEMVVAIAEARIRAADIDALIEVVSCLHQRYSELSSQLVTALVQIVVTRPGATAESSSIASSSFAASGSSRRASLRLLAEMYCVGLFDDATIIQNCVKELLRGSVIAAAADGTGDQELAMTNLSVVVSFAKAAGSRFTPSNSGNDPAGETSSSPPNDESEFEEDWDAKIVPERVKTNVASLLQACYTQSCQWREAAHEALNKAEQANFQTRQSRGEVSEDAASNYEKAKRIFERVNASVTSLSETLGLSLPEFPKDNTTSRLLNTNDARGGAAAAAAAAVAAAASDKHAPRFQDEEERRFYEVLPDLTEVVSSTSSLPADGQCESQEIETLITDASEVVDVDVTTEIPLKPGEEPDGSKSSETAKDPVKDATKDSSKDTPKKSGKAGKSSKGRKGGANSSVSLADVYITKIAKCTSKAATDSLAVSIAKLGNRGLSRRLSKALFSVPSSKTNLLPFYGRFVATLTAAIEPDLPNGLYPDLANGLLKLLEDEFRQSVSNKTIEEKVLANRMRNAIFIGELVKFRLCTLATFFDLLNLCLTEFTHHNVDVACQMLETCGRWLYRSPESAIRTGNILDTIWRLKSVMNLEARHDAMIENAYFASKPPERASAKPKKTHDPLHRYIRSKIYGEMSRNEIDNTARLLRKLPWDDELERYIVRKFVKAEKLRPRFGVHVVDGLLESIRCGLEQNDRRQSQRRVAEIKLFGELHNCRGISSGLVFETLFMLITIGHDQSHAIAAPDPARDFFRAKLVCILLDTCSRTFGKGSGKRFLNVFVPYFERYLLSKSAQAGMGHRLPQATEFMVDEVFDTVIHGRRRAENLEDAIEEVGSVESNANLQNMIRMPRYHVRDAAKERAAKNLLQSQKQLPTDEQDDDEDEDDFSVDEDGSEYSESDSGDEESCSDADSETEDEEEVPLVKQVLKTEEELEFERELAGVTQESVMSARASASSSVRVPLNNWLVKGSGIGVGPGRAARSNATDAPHSTDQSSTMSFKVQIRKGGKNMTRDLEVPVESSFVTAALSASRAAEDSERAERQEIKKLVLGSKAINEPDSEHVGPPLPAGGAASQNRKVTKQDEEAVILSTLFRPKDHGHGTGGG